MTTQRGRPSRMESSRSFSFRGTTMVAPFFVFDPSLSPSADICSRLQNHSYKRWLAQ